ncbi:flagellar protein FlgN [uncultured Roseovarius sp.]|uniref:flagellar protein FlgN n=1 Tax=uncultured Roseovarius sp. TaxID=293344 RepID=UPI0026093501|nr:flagellar protein FlgN [uncultured Roseovarius sp.]
MTYERENQIIDRLDILLERERQSLLSGDLSDIENLVNQKERLIDMLNALVIDETSALQSLQRKLTRNQSLLDGTLQGIRTAAARLAAHRRLKRSMTTYDQNGRKLSITPETPRNVEKRA